MERTQPFLIPLLVSDEAIKNQVKFYYPRDVRRMRRYVVEVDRSDPRIKCIVKGLDEIVREKVVEVKERLYGCEVIEEESEKREVLRTLPNYEDLLELANKNVKTSPKRKAKKIQRNVKHSAFDKKAEIGSIFPVRINCGLVFFACRNCRVYFSASSIFSAAKLNSSNLSTLEKFNNIYHCQKCNVLKLNHYYF